MLQAKRFYLDQLKDGPVGHRTIMRRMQGKFSESATLVREALIADGLIFLHSKKRIGTTQKFEYSYKLTNTKPIVLKEQAIKSQVIEGFWPDGWPKSKGNAFDWRSKEQSIFTKAQIAQMQQKQTANRPMIVYSRA